MAAPFIAPIIGIATIWGGLALWYQAPGMRTVKCMSAAVWLAFGAACCVGLWTRWFAPGLLAFTLAYACLLIWWNRLKPSNDRVWAPDVAQMVHGMVVGSHVTLHNVRDFAWRSASDYTARWVTREFDLDGLRSADLIVSYWSGRAIAHMLISFGFDDGSHVVFSVEIRREKTEEFSEIGGFFKEFELSIIAAGERDIVRLRTNVRREDTYLYRLRIAVPAMRSLFLAYVEQANSLVRAPRFYHTITSNCTTLVYNMLKRIVGGLPFSYRVLLSGYLPEYVYQVGGLDPRYRLEQLREFGYISDRARIADQSPVFSEEIRKGIPSL